MLNYRHDAAASAACGIRLRGSPRMRQTASAAGSALLCAAARPAWGIRLGGSPPMRKTAIAAGIALLCAAASQALAADMTTKAPKAAPVAAAPVCGREGGV